MSGRDDFSIVRSNSMILILKDKNINNFFNYNIYNCYNGIFLMIIINNYVGFANFLIFLCRSIKVWKIFWTNSLISESEAKDIRNSG